MKQPQVKRFTATGMNGQPVRPGVAVMAQVSLDVKEQARRAALDAGCSVSEWLRRLIVKELAEGTLKLPSKRKQSWPPIGQPTKGVKAYKSKPRSECG